MVVEQLERRTLLSSIELAAVLHPGSGFSSINSIADYQGKAYLTSWGDKFLVSGGTPATTQLIATLPASISKVHAANDKLFLVGNFENPLWSSDGTAAGTIAIAPEGLRIYGKNHWVFGDKLFFHGSLDGTNFHPWISDGTLAGTRPLLPEVSAAILVDPAFVNQWLFFVAGTSGEYKIYRTDGTPENTKPIFNVPTLFANEIARVGDRLFVSLPSEQWSIDINGSGSLISSLFNAKDLYTWNGVVYFSGQTGGSNSLGYELWRSDGTTSGTYIVKDIREGWFPSYPENFIAGSSRLYFTANDGTTGVEWWYTDGTTHGTKLVGEVAPESAGLNLATISAKKVAAIGNTIYFSYSATDYGPELWQTDGTAAGTRMVQDLRTGWPGSWPSEITAVGPTVMFQASNDTISNELFRYRHTADGMVSGVVYHDSNADSVQQGSETGIANARVFIDANGNGKFDAGEYTTTTDSAGRYALMLPTGVRTITVIPPTRMQTTSLLNVGVVGGQTVAINVGLLSRPAPTLTASQHQVFERGTVTLRATAVPYDGVISVWQWDLAYDGVEFKPTSTSALPSFSAGALDGPGLVHAAVRVRDEVGLWSQVQVVPIKILNAAPTGTLQTGDFVELGQPVNLTVINLQDSAADLATIRFCFDFDNDGVFEIEYDESNTAVVPAHYFTAPGPYNFRARLTDKDGGSNVINGTVRMRQLDMVPQPLTDDAPLDTAAGTLRVLGDASYTSYTYSLVQGEGASDNGKFRITGSLLRVNAPLDYDSSGGVYSVRVRATDSVGRQYERALEVQVASSNVAPLSLWLSNQSVQENLPAGTVVGTILATDPNVGDVLTFALVSGEGSANNTLFEIVGDKLRTKASFNYEGISSYSIRLRVTDAKGEWLEQALVINITDVNERPTGIALSRSNVNENVPVGTLVGLLSASDPDAGQTFTFALVSGAGSAQNTFFRISGNELRTAMAIDYEALQKYAIRIRVTDQGGESFERAFTINANDVDDRRVLTIHGTDADDTIRITQDDNRFAISRNGGVSYEWVGHVSGFLIYGNNGDDLISLSSGIALPATIYGGAGNDTLIGGAGNDVIFGNDGHDLIIGNGGDDELRGGLGDDTILGGAGNDSIYGGDGRDLIRGGDGNDYIEARGKADTIFGDAGDDTIIGGAGSDLIFGGPGNDHIDAGSDGESMAFSDTVVGGEGTNYTIVDARDIEFHFVSPTAAAGSAKSDGVTTAGPLLITGTDGNDTIVVSQTEDRLYWRINNVAYYRPLHLVTEVLIDALGGDDLVFLADPDAVTVPATVYGGLGNDTIFGGDGPNVIFGNEGDDLIIGGAGNDVIRGGLGDDTILGMRGDDSIYGGDGRDLICGGDGNNYIEGRGKADTIFGGAGNDTIHGGAGDDIIFAGEGDNWIDVHDGPTLSFRDKVFGGPGYDKVRADDWTTLVEVDELLA